MREEKIKKLLEIAICNIFYANNRPIGNLRENVWGRQIQQYQFNGEIFYCELFGAKIVYNSRVNGFNFRTGTRLNAVNRRKLRKKLQHIKKVIKSIDRDYREVFKKLGAKLLYECPNNVFSAYRINGLYIMVDNRVYTRFFVMRFMDAIKSLAVYSEYQIDESNEVTLDYIEKM